MMKCHSHCTMLMLLRMTVGVSLALVGLAHYLTLSDFLTMAEQGFGSLVILGTIGAYLIPAMEIVGGLWFAIDAKNYWAGKLVGLTFMFIAVGLLLKSVVGTAPLGDVMAMVQGTLLWFLIATVAVALPSCGHTK